MSEPLADILAPCGLYCAVCLDNIVNHECHGCGCSCGQCAGQWHGEHCDIAQCALSRGFEACAECEELPCTKLIFCAYHPFCIHHLPAIEILRRLSRVGKQRVMGELRAAFADEEKRLRWAFIEQYGDHRREAYRAWRAAQ